MNKPVPVFFLLFTALGCSSGSGSASGNGGGAPAKCDQLLGKWCGKAADCGVQNGQLSAGERDSTASGCLQEAHSTVDCSAAVSVTSSYATCLGDIDSLSCATFATSNIQMPSTCQGVIEMGPRSSSGPEPISDNG